MQFFCYVTFKSTAAIRVLVSQGLQLMNVHNNKSDVKEAQMIFWRLKKSIKILQIKSEKLNEAEHINVNTDVNPGGVP